jgi:uncharacterized membrane protein
MDQSQPQSALNLATATVLVWGFRISAALLLLGLVLSAIQGEGLHTSLESIPDLASEIADGNGAGIVGLAILVMMATPIASTISVVISCLRIGDRRYAAITAAVLVILIVSAVISAL